VGGAKHRTELEELAAANLALQLEVVQRRRADELFSLSFENAPIGLALVGPDGRWLKVNRALCDLVGYTADALLTMTFQDITHPDDLEADLECVRRMLAGEIRTYSMEKRYVHARGHVVWVNLSASLLRDDEGRPLHFISQVEDITERKAAEDVLRASEQRFRRLIETSAEAFIAAGRDGVVIEWNRKAEEMFGWKRAEILGRSLADTVVPPRYRPAHIRGLTGFLATRESPVLGQRLELEGRHRDGREFPVELTIWALDAGGDVQFNALVRDISRRKQLEATKDELDELKDAFVRTVSHDLRSPLAVIGGLAEVLQTDPPMDLDAQRSIAGRIEANAARLERLESNHLDYDRVSHGRLPLHCEPTDVSALVGGVAANVEVDDHPLGVESEPATADVDRTKMERIVENLVANAARHTPEGTPIWVRVSAVPDGVLIAVDDAGPGVPDTLKRTIFEPYHRDRLTGGAGIGLSLVARFAELHDGRAWVEDRPGGGASFRVLIPQPARQAS